MKDGKFEVGDIVVLREDKDIPNILKPVIGMDLRVFECKGDLVSVRGFLDDKNYHRWFANRFKLKEADVPVEKNIVEPFPIGSKVRVITRHFGQQQFGKEGTVLGNNRAMGDFIYQVQFDRGRNNYRIGDLELVLPKKEEEKHMLTRFVFCSRGGKYYEKGDYNTLEAATNHAKRLRRRYGTEDIHPFVIVEE